MKYVIYFFFSIIELSQDLRKNSFFFFFSCCFKLLSDPHFHIYARILFVLPYSKCNTKTKRGYFFICQREGEGGE